MIELACLDDGLKISKLEYSYELDKLKIGRFDYFNKHLGMSDYMGNFKSWLKRQSVTLIVGIDTVTIVGWVMTERWNQNAKDGRPIYVLRAIEVSPAIARKGVGRSLFLLSSKACSGHMLTKPVNSVAKAFFISLGFQEPGKGCPIDLGSYPGYLFLPEDYGHQNIPVELKINNGGLLECQKDLLVKDISEPAFTPVIVHAVTIQTKETTPTKGTAKHDVIKDEPKATLEYHNVQTVNPVRISTSYDIPGETDSKTREFLKDHKMMSSCTCGEYMTHKYGVSGGNPGFLFICIACGKERYFLKHT